MNHLSIRLCMFLVLFGMLCELCPVWAQTANPRATNEPWSDETYPLPKVVFDKTDIVNAKVMPFKRTYFLGEPVVIPIRLINHSRSPLHIETNVIPQSYITVTIRQEGKRSRRYEGPYNKGIYMPQVYYLYPLDEVTLKLFMWNDPQSARGLAFDEPGTYFIEMSLKLDIEETKFSGSIQLDTVQLTITPPPTELAPLIDELCQDKVFNDLQFFKVPKTWIPKGREVLKKYPVCSLTPYLQYAMANILSFEWHKDQTNKALADEVMYDYQLATFSDSDFKMDIYLDLLAFVDMLDQPSVAYKLAEKMIQEAPEEYLGHIGDSKVVNTYIKNSKELSPLWFWPLFE